MFSNLVSRKCVFSLSSVLFVACIMTMRTSVFAEDPIALWIHNKATDKETIHQNVAGYKSVNNQSTGQIIETGHMILQAELVHRCDRVLLTYRDENTARRGDLSGSDMESLLSIVLQS